MDKISRFNVVHRLEKRKLLIAVNSVSCLSILFFGYDQGLMGGINSAKDYVERMGFGTVDENNKVTVTNSLLQGGIIAVYYIGTLLGCLLGGWFGDRMGRIKTIGLGCVWGILGACLQTTAQNKEWMICARIVNGIGTGILNVIVPVWATEAAEHTSRGQFIAIEFTLNIFGVLVAYWLEYGTSKIGDGSGQFRWRFPIGFQIIFLVILLSIVWYFPESPRWLTKVGREDEARYILGRLRGETGEDTGRAEAEFQDIRNVVLLERKTAKRNSYFSMLFGIGSGKLHIGRRVQLVIWIMIMQHWTGIAGVVVYQQTIFDQAGFSPDKSGWFSGVNILIYTISTLFCVFTIDKIGRRWTLYWGSVVQGIFMLLAGGLSKVAADARNNGNISKAETAGSASAAMVVLYTATFGASWLTVPWLYPAEIFPLEVRARGNAWGVVGWSIANGWLTLLCPVMFKNIGEKTLYIFGACNFITVPIIWALYPESNQRTLEEMDLLFASDSIWNWEAERNFAVLKEQNPEITQAAARGHSVIDPETGLPTFHRRAGHQPTLEANAAHDDSLDEKAVVTHHQEG